MAPLRLVVIGREGQIARALTEAAAGAGHVQCVPLGRPEIDLVRPDTIAPALRAARPDLVVNAAAYTAVDKAEGEPSLAYAVNRDGAAAVAEAALACGVPLIHFSTDYVYDGEKAEPYVEDDPTGPQGVYGASKLAGEAAVRAVHHRAAVLRTAWVYAPFGTNFLRTMLRLAAERPSLRVVDDQEGCPTYAPDVATATIRIARQMVEAWRPGLAGITHLSGPTATTWCGFARAIMAESLRRGGPSVPVEAITTAEYPTPARRPRNSRLDTARLAALFDVALPPLADALARAVPLAVNAGARP